MKLDHVSDHDLLYRVGKLMGSQRELTAKLVAYLAEIERRNLHLVAGFSSLFEFCLKELRMSEGEAYRRMTAARISRRFPVVLSLLASGAVHLSALELLRNRLTDVNHAELLAAASGKTKREIEQLLAARFPKADVPDRIQPCPQPSDETAHFATNAPAAAGPVAAPAPAPAAAPAPAQSRIQPLSANRYEVGFTASAELCEKLELARDLLSHVNPSRALEAVIERAIDLLITKLERRKFGKTKGPERATTRRNAPEAEAGKSSHVSQATRREVAARDGLQCTYVSSDGRRCAARAFLEFDHADPRALGGTNHADNLRIRCRAHNQLWAEQCFGREHVRGRRHSRQQQLQQQQQGCHDRQNRQERRECQPRRPDRTSARGEASSKGAGSDTFVIYEKVRKVLTNLGFRDAESRRVVGELAARHGHESESVTLEELVREALSAMDVGRCPSPREPTQKVRPVSA